MTEIEAPEVETMENKEMSDDEAIQRIVEAMGGNTPTQEEKHNVHTFLTSIVNTEDIDKVIKVGNLRDDRDLNELGNPQWNVRGALKMARISNMIMDNPFFQKYFEAQARETTASSLSREGFLPKLGTITTKQMVDATKRRRVNKGLFGKRTVEESGGDITGANRPIQE